ncbi:hypothetical protein JCM1840_002213 [Sporobolomyces johnsonii]
MSHPGSFSASTEPKTEQQQLDQAVDARVVEDLVKQLFDPAPPHTRSPVRTLISPNLSISFPFLPQAVTSSPSASAASYRSAQALALFHLPSLGVNTLPGAKWSINVTSISKADTALEHVSVGSALREYRADEAGEVEGEEHWRATVEWTIKLPSGSAAAASKGRGRSKETAGSGDVEPPVYSRTTFPRSVDLIFAREGRPLDALGASRHLDREPTGLSYAAQDKGKEREIEEGRSGVEKVKSRDFGADGDASLLRLVHVKYTLPPHATSVFPFNKLPLGLRNAFERVALWLIAFFLPVAYLLLRFLGLDQTTRRLNRSDRRRSEGRLGGHRDSKSKGKERSHSFSTTPASGPGELHVQASLPEVTMEEATGLRLIRSLAGSQSSDVDPLTASSSDAGGRSRRRRSASSSAVLHRSSPSVEDLPSSYTLADQRRPRFAVASVFSFISLLLDVARTVASEASDVGWVIRRGVVLFSQLIFALVAVLRGMFGLNGSSEQEAAMLHGIKRRGSSTRDERSHKTRRTTLAPPMSASNGEGSPKHLPSSAPHHLSKRVSFSASEAIIDIAAPSPESSRPPSPSKTGSADPVLYETDPRTYNLPGLATADTESSFLHFEAYQAAAAAARENSDLLAQTYSPTHGAPIEVGPKGHDIVAKEAAMIGHVRSGAVDELTAIQRLEELEDLKRSRRLHRASVSLEEVEELQKTKLEKSLTGQEAALLGGAMTGGDDEREAIEELEATQDEKVKERLEELQREACESPLPRPDSPLTIPPYLVPHEAEGYTHDIVATEAALAGEAKAWSREELKAIEELEAKQEEKFKIRLHQPAESPILRMESSATFSQSLTPGEVEGECDAHDRVKDEASKLGTETMEELKEEPLEPKAVLSGLHPSLARELAGEETPTSGNLSPFSALAESAIPRTKSPTLADRLRVLEPDEPRPSSLDRPIPTAETANLPTMPPHPDTPEREEEIAGKSVPYSPSLEGKMRYHSIVEDDPSAPPPIISAPSRIPIDELPSTSTTPQSSISRNLTAPPASSSRSKLPPSSIWAPAFGSQVGAGASAPPRQLRDESPEDKRERMKVLGMGLVGSSSTDEQPPTVPAPAESTESQLRGGPLSVWAQQMLQRREERKGGDLPKSSEELAAAAVKQDHPSPSPRLAALPLTSATPPFSPASPPHTPVTTTALPAPSLDTETAPWSPESATATLTSEPETAPTSPEIGRGGAVLAERGPWWAGEPKKQGMQQEEEQGAEAGPSECAPSHEQEQGEEGEHEQEGGEGAGVEKKKKKHRRHKSKKKGGRGASEGGVGETMGNAGA